MKKSAADRKIDREKSKAAFDLFARDLYERALIMWDLVEQEALRSLPRTQEQQDEMIELCTMAWNERHDVVTRRRKYFADGKKRWLDHRSWHRMGGVMPMHVVTWNQRPHKQDGKFLETAAYHFVVSHNYEPAQYMCGALDDLDGWYLGCKFCNFLLAPEYKNWTEWRLATVRAHTDRCALRYLIDKYKPETIYMENNEPN